MQVQLRAPAQHRPPLDSAVIPILTPMFDHPGLPNVSPLSLTFSNQLVGTASASQAVTLTNTGTLPLSISSLSISSDWTESSNCLPAVAPNGSCTINVSFQPTSPGQLTGALTLTD